MPRRPALDVEAQSSKPALDVEAQSSEPSLEGEIKRLRALLVLLSEAPQVNAHRIATVTLALVRTIYVQERHVQAPDADFETVLIDAARRVLDAEALDEALG